MQVIAEKMMELDSGSIMVLDSQGQIQAETESGLYKTLNPKLPDIDSVSLQTLSTNDRTYSVSAQGLKDQQGQSVGYLVSAHDITAHHQQVKRMEWILMLLTAFTLLAAILALWYFVRRSFRPLQTAVGCLSELARGNLNQESEITGKNDEIGQLNLALNSTISHLREMVEGIASTSTQVLDFSKQLNGLSNNTASHSLEQQQRVNQIVTATIELNSASGDLAKNISNISTYTSETNQIASDGSGIVKEVIEDVYEVTNEISQLNGLVGNLKTSSANITQIIGVIKGISEQTNLLALNAAIEAARAGQNGRGFAVVADEVRKLSKHTHQSVAQIEDVICQIQKQAEDVTNAVEISKQKTEHSVALSARAVESLEQIEQRVASLQENIDAGASAAEEMAATSRSIMEDAHVISSITDQVSDAADQVSGSSGKLHNLAEELSGRIGLFNANR
jgi:methyl-accepting chemotaxis protein